MSYPLKKTSYQSHGIILSEMLTKFRRWVREKLTRDQLMAHVIDN